MKTKHIIIGMALALGIIGIQNIQAQSINDGAQKHEFRKHEKGEMFNNQLPNLTDEQKGKIKDIKVSQYKEILPLKNHMAELRAKEHTLTTMEKPDLASIDANIDEITKTQNQILKIKVKYKLQIRALLTDEQRMMFDMRNEHHQKRFKNEGFERRGECHQEEMEMPAFDK
jgi:Spy/CpxP family protein refolding chaperone